MAELGGESFWVVIPAFNEEKSIGRVVGELRELGMNVLVSDDRSEDRTGEVARAAGAEVVVSENVKNGYDANLSWGINAAFEKGASVVLTADADGEHPPREVARLMSLFLRSDAVFLFGVRRNMNRPIEKLLGRISSLIYSCPDPFSGVKGYKRAAFEKLQFFPDDLNLGTLPLAWCRNWEVAALVEEYDTLKREDDSRVPWGTWRATFRFSELFWRTVSATKWS